MATPKFTGDARNAGFIRNASAIINVEDVGQTLTWYHEVLGMQIEFAWGEPIIHGSVLAGTTAFHFSKGEPFEPPTSYMTMYVTDLDTLFADISSREVEVVSKPEVMPWGMRAFMIRDCNGCLLMFADPSTGE